MNEYLIEIAKMADISAIASLFTESFKDSVLHHCGGKLPKPQAMRDVFLLVYQAEPTSAFVARTRQGKLVGYCFAPAALSRLWLKAIAGGHIFKWIWRWLSGQYGFGFYPLKIIVYNKFAFLRSAATPTKAANARILSIAVAKEARSQGVAGKLMSAALENFRAVGAKRVRLEVRPDNLPAIKVYHKQGFVEAGFTNDSQGPWLIMFKEME
ncbi:MAG: rimI: ribosomal-protein-alanine acetyltransferase [Firmicutes bacterium]|nr:rimI: ribosomal-protein-alanine acetyltransferase [Bacillota bacterium]